MHAPSLQERCPAKVHLGPSIFPLQKVRRLTAYVVILGVQTFHLYGSVEAANAKDVMYERWNVKEQKVAEVILDYNKLQRRDAYVIKAIDCRGFYKPEYLKVDHSGLYPDKVYELMDHDDFPTWWAKVRGYVERALEKLEGDLLSGKYHPTKRLAVDVQLVLFCEKGKDRSPALSQVVHSVVANFKSKHFQFSAWNIAQTQHICKTGWRMRQLQCDRVNCRDCFGPPSQRFLRDMLIATGLKSR